MHLTRYGRMQVNVLKLDKHDVIEGRTMRLPAKYSQHGTWRVRRPGRSQKGTRVRPSRFLGGYATGDKREARREFSRAIIYHLCEAWTVKR